MTKNVPIFNEASVKYAEHAEDPELRKKQHLQERLYMKETIVIYRFIYLYIYLFIHSFISLAVTRKPDDQSDEELIMAVDARCDEDGLMSQHHTSNEETCETQTDSTVTNKGIENQDTRYYCRVKI